MATIYLTATSVDGFIADEAHSLSWLFDVPREDTADDGGMGAFFEGIGAAVMGATTYRWILDAEDMLAHPERWHATQGDRPTWVFTRAGVPRVPGADVRVVGGDVAPVHAAAVEAAAGRDVWLAGGGDLVGQFADAGLLDEIRLSVAPAFLGAGAPLLPRRITSERLRLRHVERRGPDVDLVYAVGAPSAAT